jgi:glycosyltransferase involved in cell wall biosynthesis
VAERPSLAFLIPTYNRSGHVTRLLRTLAADPDVRTAGVPVLVADNGSDDGTPDAIRAVAAEHPHLDLRLQEHGRNLGAIRTLSWLAEHAPDVDYVWFLGDDDAPVPGAVAKVLDSLAERPVRLLHLPHTFETEERVAARSICPAETDYYPSSRELSRVYHHWATFLSASVVDRKALAAAARELPTLNEWAPHIWYLNAGLDGECAVYGESLVRGGMDISWHATRVEILTTRLIEAYDEGLCRVMDERDFAQYLDDFYPDVGREPWAQVPLETLVATLQRFPHSRELRGMLFTSARAQSRTDALQALDVAARGAGAGEDAETAVAAGEERFAAGDLHGAIERFRAALRELPTCTEAWNDLGVALHAVGDATAAQAFDVALAIDPQNADALANLASVA